MVNVSIVIPVYNAECFLTDCLSSLKKQTLKDIEVIMVNDGSSDSSQEICESYCKSDERFILINQENGGSASARKAGMLAAKGDYIGFVDADDWAAPNMYEKLYTVAIENDADIVFCNCYRNDGDKEIKCKRYLRNGFYNRKQIEKEILSRTLAGLNDKGRNDVIRWANYLRIYRRSLIEEHKIYNDPRFRRCQDLQLTFEATLHAQRYVYLGDEYLYHNRVVKGSQSRGYTKNQWGKIRILIERLYQDVDNYRDVDLHEQMDLCTFFFAAYSCENECRECEGITEEQRAQNIMDILNDSLCERMIHSIPFEKLNKAHKLYYLGIKNKDLSMINKANETFYNDIRVSKMKSAVLHIPFMRQLHKLFRSVFL